MSNNINSENISDSKANNNKVKNENSSNNSDKKSAKPFNAIFYCETCKRTPLLVFSEKSPKILKYCQNNILVCDLLNLICSSTLLRNFMRVRKYSEFLIQKALFVL